MISVEVLKDQLEASSLKKYLCIREWLRGLPNKSETAIKEEAEHVYNLLTRLGEEVKDTKLEDNTKK